ncbi:hypothetical protein [Streptomyces sp. A0592]|uniref:hypothetical protein n=1 Tax=Streptomyces sp. A0592 TaxID=2563099 RepID=UPI0014479883|nr:hypothetical protein [Streptomyces sp. A0592]
MTSLTRTDPARQDLLALELRPGAGRSAGSDKRACVCGWNCSTRASAREVRRRPR